MHQGPGSDAWPLHFAPLAMKSGCPKPPAMDGNELVKLARQLYVDQLVGFLRNQFAKYPGGSAEVTTTRSSNPNLYGAHYRVDFVTGVQANANGSVVVELVPDNQLAFEPITGSAGQTRVRVEQLNWDDVEITHDLTGDLAPLLQPWFDHWYDPDDKRVSGPGQPPPDVIHSLGVYPGALVIDFGTASPDAFWSLVTILRDAGAKQLTVRATRQSAR
jgi:hypothetical protein